MLMHLSTLSSCRPISRSSTIRFLPHRSTLGYHPSVHVDCQPFLVHHPHYNVTLRRKCSCIHVTSQAQRPSFNVTSTTQRPHIHFSNTTKLTVVVTVKRKHYPSPQERALDQLDCILDLSGQKVVLQLVSSSKVDSKTGFGKRSNKASIQDWAQKANTKATKVQYIVEFIVSSNFGIPGAISLVNNHNNEFFIETIALHGLEFGKVYFSCYSWVQPKSKYPHETIFFSNNVYLPSETPNGLKKLREYDMGFFRGSDTRTCMQEWDKIYDYDVYKDIGDPDKDEDLARPNLGGVNLPYPRRLRTGRSCTKADANAESPLRLGNNYYVPRDEAFEEVKRDDFMAKSLKGVVHHVMPILANSLKEGNDEFQCFQCIEKLYEDGIGLINFEALDNKILKAFLGTQLLDKMRESSDQISDLFQYAQPHVISRDHFRWMRDEEFGRQLLAGANPVDIQRVQEFPMKSGLDPMVYGSPVSTITKEHLIAHLEGLSVEQAIDEKRLYVLDYHDAFMPFITKVNKMEGRKMYATRTILFYTREKFLIPIIIELSLPPSTRGHNAWRRVFTRGDYNGDGGTYWKWQLAKAHVSSNDAGYHQLVNHWLRSHAVVEPFVIASNRQLSRMHPILKLLKPHFRYTLAINASARQLLINAGGIIENTFTSGPFSLAISSAAYKSSWRFDHESLPMDLLKRGMAIEDATAPNGIKLVLEDYPYASDGMLVWTSITSWVDEYVSLYYKDEKDVQGDLEIQAWWEEIKNKGHPDKKDESWWPPLNTPGDLKSILSTIIWIVSGFHAAVNFGQYAYGAYVPNRPCMTRRLIPDEDDIVAYREFSKNPEKFFLSCIPNKFQATTTMSIVDTLSTHSVDEEYLGERAQTNWTSDMRAIEAFKRFSLSMVIIEKEIAKRNKDPKLKHRNGVGVLPYELLVPNSSPGRTCKGVPNSTSI